MSINTLVNVAVRRMLVPIRIEPQRRMTTQ
jgi:hypothetical protein